LWKIDFAKEEDNLFIKKSGSQIHSELNKYFKNITETFDSLNSSVMCTSVIYDIKTHTISNQNVSINYHIDSDDKVIRITSIDIK
jgi:hypothetical protein